MLELIALAGLFIAGLAVAAVFGVVFLVVSQVVFWAVFLPFRLLFKLMWMPVGLVDGGVQPGGRRRHRADSADRRHCGRRHRRDRRPARAAGARRFRSSCSA